MAPLPPVAKSPGPDNIPQMTAPDLTPDCARCDALCCVLLAFDASTAFAFDKPACVACRHLAPNNACTIHADLEGQGFRGCRAFDCHGAGQRLTQSLKGRSWRSDPSLLPALDDAFRTLRRLHETLALLHAAAKLPLTPAQEATRAALLDSLSGQDMTPDLAPAQAFFKSLRP